MIVQRELIYLPDTPQIQNYPLQVCTSTQNEFSVTQENPLHLNGTDKFGGNQKIYHVDMQSSLVN